MTFWVAVVVIVLVLEAVRIGLSSYLLLHVLRGLEGVAEPREPVSWLRERDRLAGEAMTAVRQAMDGLAGANRREAAGTAIEALDRYVLHHQERAGR
ncbi:MAG: hypothetical protein R2849_16120 [Thermomicrobiales bacterium]